MQKIDDVQRASILRSEAYLRKAMARRKSPAVRVAEVARFILGAMTASAVLLAVAVVFL